MDKKHPTGEKFKKVADELFEGRLGDLAKALGMQPGSFSKYTTGRTHPGHKILKRLIALDINLNWFLAGIPPMLISDIKEAGVTKIKAPKAAEASKDYFSEVDQGDLSDAEYHLLVEVKQFSAFLENRQTLRPQVKRMILELLIQCIDQAAEQPQHDPDDN